MEPFTNYSAGSAACRITRDGKISGEQAYLVSPFWGGGTNEFRIADAPKSPQAISFLVKPDNEPKWDLYFNYGDKPCKVVLFGSTDHSEASQFLGKFELEELEGGVLRARADLERMLDAMYPNSKEGISDMRFAVRTPGLVQAAYNGNSANSAMHLTEPMFSREGSEPANGETEGRIVWGKNGPCVVVSGRYESQTKRIKVDGDEWPVWNGGTKYNPLTNETSFVMAYMAQYEGEVEWLVKLADGTELSDSSEVETVKDAWVVRRMSGTDRTLRFSFENERDFIPLDPEDGTSQFGPQKQASATHLSRVNPGDPSMGTSVRVLCTTQAAVFGIRLPFEQSLYSYPVVDLMYMLPQKENLELGAFRGRDTATVSIAFKGTSFFGGTVPKRHDPLMESSQWSRLSVDHLLWTLDSGLSSRNMYASHINIGDFATRLGHFDGTWFMLDELAYYPPSSARGDELLFVVAGPQEMYDHVYLESIEGLSDSSYLTRGKRQVKMHPLVGSNVWALKAKDVGGEGHFRLSFRVPGSRKLAFYNAYIDHSPPIAKKARYRIHPTTGQFWMNLYLEETSGMNINDIKVMFNDKALAQDEFTVNLVSRGLVSFRLAPEYAQLLKEEGHAVLMLKDLTDSAGHKTKEPVRIELEGVRGTVELQSSP
ncbi:MAG: hypothetical protein U5N86_12610 [Planctomycetota bacterium]|nr:hypothetical protein [Planctomycetota bacterium]